MASTNEETVPPKKLTDDQLAKMEKIILKMSDRLTNPLAMTLAHNLRRSQNVEEKRKWIVTFYANSFQLLSFLNLARDNVMSMDEFDVQLELLFKGK